MLHETVVPCCHHVLLFAALLDHVSLPVASAAFAALASCLDWEDEGQGCLLEGLAPAIGAALGQPGLLEAVQPDAVAAVALHAASVPALKRLAATEVRQMAQLRVLVGHLRSAAAAAARHAAAAMAAAAPAEAARSVRLVLDAVAAAMLLDAAGCRASGLTGARQPAEASPDPSYHDPL